MCVFSLASRSPFVFQQPVEQIVLFSVKEYWRAVFFSKKYLLFSFCQPCPCIFTILLQEWKHACAKILRIVLRQRSVEGHKPIFNCSKRHGRPDGHVPLKRSQSFPSSQPAKCLFINHLTYKDNGTRTHFPESPHWSICASHSTRVKCSVSNWTLFQNDSCTSGGQYGGVKGHLSFYSIDTFE